MVKVIMQYLIVLTWVNSSVLGDTLQVPSDYGVPRFRRRKK